MEMVVVEKMTRTNLELSEKEIKYLSIGIASGSGIGIISGAIVNNVQLFFSLGSVLGIIGAVAYSYYLRYKK